MPPADRAPASGDLPAGRELDALVAEKVMGEPRPLVPTENIYVSPWQPTPSKGGAWMLCDIYGEEDYVWIPRPYSTSIAAAWTVVEKLSPAHPFILSDSGSDPEALGPWEAWFGERYAVSVTAPHAICLAALRAVEGET